MNVIKLNVIGTPSGKGGGTSGGGGGGEGVATIDFSSIGYDTADVKSVQSKARDAVAYSKTLYDAWDASKTSAKNLYAGRKAMVYAPNIDTSSVTDMSQMFNSCSSLQTIPLLDTSSVTNMSQMFNSCSSLQSIPQLNTSKVTNMNNMFTNCDSLQTIPLLDTSSVTNMSQMFNYCYSLQSIPQLDTSSVTNMSQMFNSCSSLQTIPLLDTSSVTNMSNMFYNCSALQNLGGFKNLKVSLLLSGASKITHDSLMNVINNLYDLTANGLSGQTLTIGSTNMAKLTADEIAIATNKGWTVK